MGNTRKPDSLKLIQGTARSDRSNPSAPAPSQGVCVAPEWLSTRAAEVFGHLTATLEGTGFDSPDYQVALAMLASRIAEVETLTANVEDSGHTYRTESGLTKPNPAVAMRSEAMRHAQSLCVEFGLTPAARSKVSAGKPAEKNPFAALG